jgi:hypothetical protein
MKEVYSGMDSNSQKVNKTLIYGNNQTSKVSKVASLGQLKEIVISSSLSDNIISVSQLASLGYTIVFSKRKAHILSKDYEMFADKEQIIKSCKGKNGLYYISLDDLSEILLEEADSDSDVEDEDNEMKDDE